MTEPAGWPPAGTPGPGRTVLDLLALGGVAVLVAAVLALVATAGGRLAERVGVDRVVGEIGGGLAVACGVAVWAGPGGVTALVPAPALSAVRLLAEAGLALFLVGVVHELASVAAGAERRAVAAVGAATLLGPLLLGGLLGLALLSGGGDGIRAPGPAPAFVLFVGVAVSVTAVPVLARIVTDRGVGRTRAARVALSAAVGQDAVCWILLAVAVALHTADGGRVVPGLLALAGGVGVVLVLRRLLGTGRARRADGLAAPVRVGVVVAVAWGAAALSESLGMTAVFGAVIAGLAFPRDGGGWPAAVSAVAGPARRVVPLYVAVSALGAVGGTGSPVWWLVPAVVGAAVLGKAGAGYAAARLAGLPPADAGRVAAMMNTRGLTEVVVLDTGVSTGIVGGALLVAFLVMTAVTTLATGPSLALLDRRRAPLR